MVIFSRQVLIFFIGIMAGTLVFSCRTIGLEPVVVRNGNMECRSELPYKETRLLLDQLAAIQNSLYGLLEIRPVERSSPLGINIHLDKKNI